jgi:hypothetical protein
MNRRNFISAAAVAAIAAEATLPAAAAPESQESPELIAAHKRLIAAQDEFAAAEDALEWLLDEWSHVWPLAPEELLLAADVHLYGSAGGAYEKNILGGYMIRDTSTLTTRFRSAKQRAETPETCFALDTVEWAETRFAAVSKSPVKGRTAKSLARNQADRAAYIAQQQKLIAIARAYEDETKRVRELAGVDAAHARKDAAFVEICAARSEIAMLPAVTREGIRIKATVLLEFWDKTTGPSGKPNPKDIVGQTHMLLRTVLEMSGGRLG